MEGKKTLSTKNKLPSYVICLDEQQEKGFVLPLSMQKCSPDTAAAPKTILGSLIDWYLTVFEVWVYQSPRRLNSGAQLPREWRDAQKLFKQARLPFSLTQSK